MARLGSVCSRLARHFSARSSSPWRHCRRHAASRSSTPPRPTTTCARSEEHTSELQSHRDLVCRLLLEKKNKVSAALDLVHQQTQDQRHGYSHIGATAQRTA